MARSSERPSSVEWLVKHRQFACCSVFHRTCAGKVIVESLLNIVDEAPVGFVSLEVLGAIQGSWNKPYQRAAFCFLKAKRHINTTSWFLPDNKGFCTGKWSVYRYWHDGNVMWARLTLLLLESIFLLNLRL